MKETQEFGGWCCDVRCCLRNAYNYKVNNSITLRVLYLAGYGSYQAAEKIWKAKDGSKLANGN